MKFDGRLSRRPSAMRITTGKTAYPISSKILEFVNGRFRPEGRNRLEVCKCVGKTGTWARQFHSQQSRTSRIRRRGLTGGEWQRDPISGSFQEFVVGGKGPGVWLGNFT